MRGLRIETGESPGTKSMCTILPLYRSYIQLPDRNTFMVNSSESKSQMLLKPWLHHVTGYMLQMKTYRPPIQSNGRDFGFVKVASVHTNKTASLTSFSCRSFSTTVNQTFCTYYTIYNIMTLSFSMITK